MPEAVNGVREFRCDRRIEVDIDVAEEMDRGRDLAGEFLEHEVLVLRLGAELPRLEQAFTVPFGVRDYMAAIECRAGQHPLACKGGVAGVERLLHEAFGFLDEA